MEKRSFSIPEERRTPLIVLAAGLLLIALFLVLALQPGINYKGEFLKRQAEGRWQGRVLGELTTVTWDAAEDGAVLQVDCDSGRRTYALVGDRDSLVLYEDGTELFRGSYTDGYLRDASGEMEHGIVVSAQVSGGSFIIDEDGN